MRTTIDFGIDLGTTNSAIALLKGTSTEIIKNEQHADLTSSAVYMDSAGKISIGLDAKDQLGRDKVAIEFKRKMGTSENFIFSKANRRMKPEELSAEVLKSLKSDVRSRFNEELTAAAITVPAVFEMPQCEATQKAARLAGIELCPLLQEPVAASLSYGFQGKENEREIWLVYDLGGGTFDAALMQIRDGIIQVLAHKGDNHLGGSLIDDAIIEQLLVPELLFQYKLPDFRSGNPRWKTTFGKLKKLVEDIKIRLSRSQSKDLKFYDLGVDEDGRSIDLEYDLTQQEVASCAQPFIRRSILMCLDLFREKKLRKDDISKVLLVGGPTLAPYLREYLADEREGLGIPLDFSQDPMTVVARGAAIFAGTQRIKRTTSKPIAANTYSLQLEYEPIGTDADPFIAGKVISQTEDDFTTFTIEFVNETSQPTWHSGKAQISRDGAFAISLWAQKDLRNEYRISLFDPTGSKRIVSPDSITYTIGSTTDKQPLLNDIAIALKNNETDVIFEKGSALPLRKKISRNQYGALKKDNPEGAIRIPIIEGRSGKADRNKKIGQIVIPSSEIKRDLPSQSEIEITLSMSESRTIDLEIYIPVLDQEFNRKVDITDYQAPEINELSADFNEEESRLKELKEKINDHPDAEARRIITEIEDDRSRQLTKKKLENIGDDNIAERLAAFNCLLDLRIKLDQVENKFLIPMLEQEASEQIEDTSGVISQFGEADDRTKFIELKRELINALTAQQKNISLIREKIDALDSLGFHVSIRRPEWWLGYFEHLEKKDGDYTDQNIAARLLAAGRRDINNGHLENLQNVCRQLGNLLPESERDLKEGYGSTIIKTH